MRLLPSALLALALTACGQAEPPDVSIPSAPLPDAATTAPAAVEGPASEAHTWPDGLQVKLAKVEQVPRSWGVDVPADRTVLRLTLAVTNTGPAPAPHNNGMPATTLLPAPNRTAGDNNPGRAYVNDAAEDRPTDLNP